MKRVVTQRNADAAADMKSRVATSTGGKSKRPPDRVVLYGGGRKGGKTAAALASKVTRETLASNPEGEGDG